MPKLINYCYYIILILTASPAKEQTEDLKEALTIMFHNKIEVSNWLKESPDDRLRGYYLRYFLVILKCHFDIKHYLALLIKELEK